MTSASPEPRALLVSALAIFFAALWCFASGHATAGALVTLAGAAIVVLARGGAGIPARNGGVLLPALVIFVAAAALRLFRLDAVPPLWWDEAVEMHDAMGLRAGLPLEPLEGILYHRSPLWLALLAGWSGIFGDSVASFRVPAALAGAAVPALAFVLGARLCGRPAGYAAAAWLAACFWGLNLSRMAMANILVPAFGTALVLLLASGSLPFLARAATAGAIAGIGALGYAAGAHLPLLAVVLVPLMAGPGTGRGRRLAGALLCAAVALAVVAPARAVLPGAWDKVVATASLSPAAVLGNLRDSLPLLASAGDPDLRHQYPSGAPVFPFLLAPFLLLGLALAIRGLRESREAPLLLLWTALGALPGILSDGGGRNLFRMVGAMPPLAILMGLGWAAAWRALGPRLGMVLVALLAWPVAGSVGTYFTRFPGDPAVAVWYRAWDREAGADLIQMAQTRPLVLCGGMPLSRYPVERLALFGPERAGRVRRIPGECPSLPVRKRYVDPYGEIRAVLLAGKETGGKLVARGAAGAETNAPAFAGGNGVAPSIAPAIAEYRTVLDIGMEGDRLLIEGKAEAAVAHFTRWSAILGPDPVLAERLGFALLKAGRLAGAEAAFRRALDHGPRTATLLDGLAAALFRQGKTKEAEVALLEGLRLEPGHRELEADLARVRREPAGRKK